MFSLDQQHQDHHHQEILLEMQILGLYPISTESETPGVGPSNLCLTGSYADSVVGVLKLSAHWNHPGSFANYGCWSPTVNDAGFNCSWMWPKHRVLTLCNQS